MGGPPDLAASAASDFEFAALFAGVPESSVQAHLHLVCTGISIFSKEALAIPSRNS